MPVIFLAMHGAPPNDFPTNETIELFNWPFDPSQVAGFLAAQIAQFDNDRSPST